MTLQTQRSFLKPQIAKYIFHPGARRKSGKQVGIFMASPTPMKDNCSNVSQCSAELLALFFLNFKDPNKPLKSLFVVTDVTTAINEVGSTDLNHQQVSGMILHLVPDNTLQQMSYQWGSTAIMETAFETMFRVSKNKSQTFLHAGIGLHLRTFYGLLFEPYFHAIATQQDNRAEFVDSLHLPLLRSTLQMSLLQQSL